MRRTLPFLIVILGAALLGGSVSWSHPATVPFVPANPSPTPVGTAVADFPISAMVVPHHNLVKEQRQNFFRSSRSHTGTPSAIILVSPNHYNAGHAAVQTTSEDWDISAGTLHAEQSVTNALVSEGVATDEPQSFTDEHGIKVILPDIAENFAGIPLIPLIIKRDVTADHIEKLVATLSRTCENCLLIASIDFSHYQPALLANLHDSVSERGLATLDTDTLFKKAEVDSPGALLLLARWVVLHHTEHFVEALHTNSGELLKDPDIESTTHIFGWYEAGEKTVVPSSVSFSIGGDMMFGRMVAHTYLQKGLSEVFSELGERTFWGTDAGIANLEGPVSATPVPDDITPNNLVFHFPPETIGALRFARFAGVSQANNHSANAGKSGLDTTYQLLDAAGIQAIGGPGDSGIEKIGTFKGNGLTLYVIGVHTLESIPDLSPLIKKLKADPTARVIVFPHWGIEYKAVHSTSQGTQAHSWVDAGADLVIGAHPHVIEDAEVYKGVPIFYSLGNLVFDQTFSTETQQGLIISGEFTSKGLTLFALPTGVKTYKPTLLRGETKQQILTKLYAPLVSYEQQTSAGTLLSFPTQ
jgi:poly-gamma-glutamate synthesis protein (capsule biosynthesis protein)